MSENSMTTKHHQLATTGHVEGYKKGGEAKHESHGHKSVEHHHPKHHHGGHKEMEEHKHGKVEHHATGGGCGTPGGSRSKY